MVRRTVYFSSSKGTSKREEHWLMRQRIWKFTAYINHLNEEQIRKLMDEYHDRNLKTCKHPRLNTTNNLK